MHVEFVKWADQVDAESDRGQEFEAIPGYHLEQAYRHLGELGPIDDTGVAIGRDGSKRLASAGRRAFQRGDLHAAVNLLRRAASLLPSDDPQRLDLLPDLFESLMALGDFEGAQVALQEAKDRARQIDEKRVAAASTHVEMLMSLCIEGASVRKTCYEVCTISYRCAMTWLRTMNWLPRSALSS